MNAPSEGRSAKSGAAKFAGADSRRFSYFEPKARKASHYEDVTVDVQPDPKRYLLQDWIIKFADGTPGYYEGWTKVASDDWHKFRAADQEWERTHYQRQSVIVRTLASVTTNGRSAGAACRFDRAWIEVLQDQLGAYKHAEFGLGTALMRAQRFGCSQMINNVLLTNSSYKLRSAQDLALFLGDLALDIDSFDLDSGKRHWLEDPVWQGARLAVESIMGAEDYLEQYFAINVIFEPLVGHLFRNGFVVQLAPAQNDYMSPVLVAAAEDDYKRNLANAVELFSVLSQDRRYGEMNRRQYRIWAETHGNLAAKAAELLRPLWSYPSVKAATFDEAFDSAKNRFRLIAAEVGFNHRAIIGD